LQQRLPVRSKKTADVLAATCDRGKRIGIFGVGSSDMVAQDAQHKFFAWCQHGCLQRQGRYSPMVLRLLHGTIMDVLATCLALRIGGKLQLRLFERKNNLRNKRYA